MLVAYSIAIFVLTLVATIHCLKVCQQILGDALIAYREAQRLLKEANERYDSILNKEIKDV